MKAFRCVNNRGFQMTFANGVTVSVMFGAGNYCENYNMSFFNKRDEDESLESMDAEYAVFDEHGWYDPETLESLGEHTDVEGRASAEKVLEVMNKASQLPKRKAIVVTA